MEEQVVKVFNEMYEARYNDFCVIKEKSADYTLYIGPHPDGRIGRYVILGFYEDNTVIGVIPLTQLTDEYVRTLGTWFKRENVTKKGWLGKKEVLKNQGPYGETILLGEMATKSNLTAKVESGFGFGITYLENGFLYLAIQFVFDRIIGMNIFPIGNNIEQVLDVKYMHLGHVKGGRVYSTMPVLVALEVLRRLALMPKS